MKILFSKYDTTKVICENVLASLISIHLVVPKTQIHTVKLFQSSACFF